MKGLIQVYTGNGKGKTTASMGLVLRAIGQGLKVYIIQFMKGGSYTGEYVAIKNFLPNSNIVQFGKGCVKESKQTKIIGFDQNYCKKGDFVRDEIKCGDCRYCFVRDHEQREYVLDAFNHMKKVLTTGDYDLLVLDELNCAIDSNILSISDVLETLESRGKTEVVITGRNAHPKIIQIANLVTEMKPLKHYYDEGVLARKGIEY